MYGDSPYLDKTHPELPKNAELVATPAFIQTINGDPNIQEVVHVGDIHSGSEPCTKAYDQSILNLWTAFQKPLVYTPGDNEWSDCTKTNEEPGSDNDNAVTHPDLPLENLNIPGGSNNDIDPWYAKTHKTSWNPDQQAEMDRRTAADVSWLDAAFAKAEADNTHSVVIVGQADMWDTSDAPSHQTNYEPIVRASADDATAYGKPVLYLNGDSHAYRSDDPLRAGSTCYTESGVCSDDAWNQHPFYDVPNFHRIVVHGSTFPLEWLKLSIDPGAVWQNASTPTSWGPFSWERETQEQLTP